MSHNLIVRSLQIINHLALLYGLYFVYSSGEYIYLLYSLLTYWVIGVLGVNIGFHRLISHKSFKTHTYIEYFLALVGVITSIGSPLAWIALHRQHHSHADTDHDPHSPYFLGNLKAWFGMWDIKNIDLKYVKDLRRQRFYRFTHRYYLAILVAYWITLAFINPLLLIFIYSIPAVLVLHSTSTIIVIAHKHGYQTYNTNDESRNSWIANLITLGEGWHNNHHANSKNWKQGEKWWEIDPPAWIIGLIKK